MKIATINSTVVNYVFKVWILLSSRYVKNRRVSSGAVGKLRADPSLLKVYKLLPSSLYVRAAIRSAASIDNL